MTNIKQWVAPMAASIILISGHCLPAQDWPQWRGVNRDGKTGPFAAPSAWPTNLTEKWKVNVGKGDATPALVGTNLYVFTRQGTDEVLLCLDSATGQTRWKSQYAADFVVGGPAVGHPGPRSSPVVADGKVCTLGVGGILSCFDAASGVLHWRKQSTNDYLGIPYKSDSSMSPIVEEGRCIVHVGVKTNGAIISFDLASGEPKWKWDGDGPANSSPVTMTVGNKKQLVTLSAKKLVGLDLAGGGLLWQVPFEATQGNNTTPVVAGSTVICTGQGKGLMAVKIEPQEGGGFTATPLWTTAQFGARFTTPVLKDGSLYGYGGRLFCVDARNGSLLWDQAANLGQSASLVDAGPVIFALGGRGDLLVFRPGSTYAQLARIKVADSETWAHPVVAGNSIFVKDSETVSLWGIE
ncbi:MAG: PQQ-binding-like beta-propeller repeat protein [Verrucomicrobiota bacterium]|jgi:outer membrane protein assembly factor BamB